MPNPLPITGLFRTPIFDQSGMMHPDWQKYFVLLEQRTGPALNQQGHIQSDTKVSGRTEQISTTLQNVDSAGVITAGGVDLSRGYTNKTLDHIPNGTRAAWDSTTQKSAAVDSSGNLLLKNKMQVTGSTVAPTTTSSSYAVIPEMTITLTTQGNEVFVTFTGVFEFSSYTGSPNGVQLAIFCDGTQLTTDYQSTLGLQAFDLHPITLTWIDSPAAGSHTYDIRWKAIIAVGTVAASAGAQRQLQVIELG